MVRVRVVAFVSRTVEASSSLWHHWNHRWWSFMTNGFVHPPQLAGIPPALHSPNHHTDMDDGTAGTASENTNDTDGLWLFAVPKSKITRHKKRLKTTLQKRIPLRENIVTDPRTGQTTLRHHMPFNWKDYLLPILPFPSSSLSPTDDNNNNNNK